MHLVAAVRPASRVELAMGGEPTLHPDLYELLRVGRKISPLSQFQITTNGTMLTNGTVTYQGLMEAGCNIVYTDMYAPRAKFRKLADESGYPFWFYYPEGDEPVQPDGANPWEYHGPHVHWIPLQNNPSDWPDSRKRNMFGEWMGHIDERKASKFGIARVKQAPARRCNQPFISAPISWTGDYLLCCMDMALETQHHGNVSEGVDGFRRWWLGEFMQQHRRWLRAKDRSASPYCGRCSITYSRCDYKHWTEGQLSMWWDGKRWVLFDPLVYESGMDRPVRRLPLVQDAT